MDSTLIETAVTVALGLCFVLAFVAASYTTAFAVHMLRRVDESATKTALTETIKAAVSDLKNSGQ